MPDIFELNELLEEALSETQLDEKIMTKKQAARKRKLRAKKRAEKKAAQAKEVEENTNTNNTETDENIEPGTELVVFQAPKQEEYEDYNEVSEVFKKAMELFGPALEKHKEEIEKAMKMWEANGKDKACPQEAWDILNNSIQELKKEIENFVNQTDFNALPEPELLVIDKVITGINGYLEKTEQQILAAKPDLSEEDIDAPALIGTNDDSTDLTTTSSTAITPSNKQLPDDTKRNKKDLVTYDVFMGGFKQAFAGLGDIIAGIGQIVGLVLKNGAIALVKLAAHPISWINQRAWTFLTSPVSKDFVKTIAYANPLTAMIFDGKLGSFGIGNSISKLQNAVTNVLNKGKQAEFKSITEKEPGDYDARKFPKDISKKNLKQLKSEFYSNLELVTCINVAYNHPEVRHEDKAQLRKLCTTFGRAIKTKKIDLARKTFNSVIELLNKICDYMSWMKPLDWENLITRYVTAKGNTEKDLKRIENKNKPKQLTADNKIAKDAASYIKEKLPRQELVKKLTSDNFGHDLEEVNKYLDKIDYHESFNTKFNNLIKLLEEAEA